MPIKKIYLLFIFLFLCIPSISFSEDAVQVSTSSELPVYIDADIITYDKETDAYHAEGNVIVTQGDSVIISDKMDIDMLSSIATAEDNVEMIDEGGNTLKGDRLELEIDTKAGTVKNGRLFYKKENVYVSGDEIRKTDKETYDIKKGEFTTCDCKEGESPAWKFSANEADVTVGEFLTAWNAFFHIKDVPILYSPFISFPVKRERQTGFLFPGFGFSELRGFKMDNAFFWAISDNTDATFYLDVETNRGLGKGAEYRYILSSETKGEAYVYQFKEDDIDRVREFRKSIKNLSRPETASDNRWIFKFKHETVLPYNTNLKADINKVSDDEYFIDFGKSLSEEKKKAYASEYFTDFQKYQFDRSLESLETNVSLSKSWEKFNLVAQFRYFDNLMSVKDEDTLQRLPEITFTGTSQQILKTPFYFSLESSFVEFQRKIGTTGERLDIHPRISFPLRPGGYFEFTPFIAYRNTRWWVDNDIVENEYNRNIYDTGADLTTTIVRIFSFEDEEDGFQKLKHTIRPKITYTYIPDDDQSDLPSFDGVDRIGKSNTIAYSINTILTGKFLEDKNTYTRDLVYLDIRQSYDLNEAKRDIISTTDKRKPFSDITAEAILKPFQWINLTARGQYDVYDNWLERYDTSIGISDRRGDSLYAAHRYIRNDIEYLDAWARIKTTESIDLTYRIRHSYKDNKTIETEYGLDYRKQCWGFASTYTERLEEKIFMITFNLLGLGDVGSFRKGIADEKPGLKTGK
ncbi:MAG: LPS-assembly protein LptD [Deltaproteobacteria bacterium]|nr:LPS-assembly protein LptD [Deltaproteobacteria bacterium]